MQFLALLLITQLDTTVQRVGSRLLRNIQLHSPPEAGSF